MWKINLYLILSFQNKPVGMNHFIYKIVNLMPPKLRVFITFKSHVDL